MSRTNDHSLRPERPVASHSPPVMPRLVVGAAILAASVASAAQPPTGPTPSPMDFAVIQGLASPDRAGGAANPADPVAAPATTREKSTEPGPSTPTPAESSSGQAAATPGAPASSDTPEPSSGSEPAVSESAGSSSGETGEAASAAKAPMDPPRAAGQPAPMRADLIGGLTQSKKGSGAASATAEPTPRPLPQAQMDLIRSVFAPEEGR